MISSKSTGLLPEQRVGLGVSIALHILILLWVMRSPVLILPEQEVIDVTFEVPKSSAPKQQIVSPPQVKSERPPKEPTESLRLMQPQSRSRSKGALKEDIQTSPLHRCKINRSQSRLNHNNRPNPNATLQSPRSRSNSDHLNRNNNPARREIST